MRHGAVCAADEVFTFRHMGSAVLASIFGRDAPPRYRCMELVKGQPLTRPEAKLLAMHVCMNSALETVALPNNAPSKPYFHHFEGLPCGATWHLTCSRRDMSTCAFGSRLHEFLQW